MSLRERVQINHSAVIKRGKMGAIPDPYPWRIGAWVGQFTGKADEVMIFNRVLKHEEVKQLFDAMN